MFTFFTLSTDHDRSSLCARFGEIRLMALAVLLPVWLGWFGLLWGKEVWVLRFLLGLQSGIIAWIAGALAGYAGAYILRELPYCPMRRRTMLQAGQFLCYSFALILMMRNF